VALGLVAAAASGLIYLLSLVVVVDPTMSATILLLGRALLGGAESLVITSAVSLGLGVVAPQHAGRVIAWVGMAMFAALAVGAPAGTALFSAGGFVAIALATTFVPLVTLVLAFRLPAVPPTQSGMRSNFIPVVRAVWLPGVGAALSSVGFGAILAFGALLFAERGWGLVWLPFTAYAVGLIAARILLGHLPDKLGGAKVALFSVLIEGAGLSVIGLALGSGLAAVGAMLTGFGYALVYPGLGLEAVRRAPPGSRGLVMGIYTVFLDVALGFGPPVMGLIASWSDLGSVFLTSALIVILTSFIAARLIGSLHAIE
jgi:predicted MFS family arabinose efflux permease